MYRIKFIIGFALVTLSTHLLAASPQTPSSASQTTVNINNKVYQVLPFTDKQDFLDAKKGFIASFKQKNIKAISDDNLVAMDFEKWNNLLKVNSKSPSTVNPSLWRVSILNNMDGLFKVTDNIYQIRGTDLSIMSIIEAPKGLIIIDPLITPATAKAGLELYYQYRPQNKKVIAVIYTHSHVDHFGGVRGVVKQEDVDSGKVEIIAPENFVEESVSEAIYAGNAMFRRSMYTYSALLPVGATGNVGSGLGKATSAGEVTLINPTIIIKDKIQNLKVGGLKIQFLLVPGTEAPAEMVIYFPTLKALDTAELTSNTFHNLLTLRGAKVRDAVAWWKDINEVIEMYGDKTDVVFHQHGWPKWGQDNIITYLSNQRDMYKSIHDQTLFYANQGYTPNEIAELVKIPDEIANQWYNRGYYGTIRHNVKAVYQRYLGWYDGQPSNLNPLPPVEESKKYVAAMGGLNSTINIGQKAYNNGDYRWAATVLKHAVFANPNSTKAKNLLARTYEQLGYQSESAIWRGTYLTGAYELRNGVPKHMPVSVSSDMIAGLSPEMFFDYLGIKIDPKKAKDVDITINWDFTDLKEKYGSSLKNTVFIYSHKLYENPTVSISLKKTSLTSVMLKKTSIQQEIDNGNITITGDKEALRSLMNTLVTFNPAFNIVSP